MKKYRIKERINNHSKHTTYEVQKKSWLGFWYNPLNIDAYTTGIYDNFAEAKNVIDQELSKTHTKIVYEKWGR